MNTQPTIAEVIGTALDQRQPKTARQIAVAALVAVAKLEGQQGPDCPSNVSSVRMLLESAVLSSDDDLDHHIYLAHHAAETSPLVRTTISLRVI